jgi:hypothetical protein
MRIIEGGFRVTFPDISSGSISRSMLYDGGKTSHGFHSGRSRSGSADRTVIVESITVKTALDAIAASIAQITP